MIQRKKQNHESYAQYYYDKVVLLNDCDISDEKAVSCIIGGIDDRVVSSGAKAGKHTTPESLYTYLSTLNGEKTSFTNLTHFKR